MNEQEVAIKLNDHDHEIGSLKHRVKGKVVAMSGEEYRKLKRKAEAYDALTAAEAGGNAGRTEEVMTEGEDGADDK